MKSVQTLGVILFIAGTALGQNSEKFDARALFQPGMSTMQSARDTCSKGPGEKFGACFVDQMKAAGASAEAVAFMHAIHNDGFMRDFKDTGNVDIAYVDFPFAANENQHCMLINGTPSVIDVDDYNLIPRDELPKNPDYAALQQQYPNVAVFPGDRNGTSFIHETKTHGGGQQFLVPYVLVNGCHACARVGSLDLAFEFDKTGKFVGVNVARVGKQSER